jgi:hypothetical protein
MERVTAARPCPVCSKGDWCLVAVDLSACICARTESPTRAGSAGWLHRLTDRPRDPSRRGLTLRVPTPAPPPDLTDLADRFRMALDPDRLDGFAKSLGVSAESLSPFRVGWSADHHAWSWPMTDPATNRVVGIRLRSQSGYKYAITGGRDALFLPTTTPDLADPLFITEGATDAAAALTLGVTHVAGRPSCTGGVKHILALVRLRMPPSVVVVADGDGPGLAGAEHLTGELVKYVPTVRVVVPPGGAKDLRAWVRSGATRADLDRLVAAVPPRKLTVRVVMLPPRARRPWKGGRR